MLASGGLAPILLEARVLDLLQPDPRSIEADDGVLADEAEKVPPVLFTSAMMILVSQMSERLGLLLWRNFEKPASEQITGMRVNPSDSVPEAILQIRVAEDHEINELA